MGTNSEPIVLGATLPATAQPLENQFRRSLDLHRGQSDQLQDSLEKILSAPELAALPEADHLTARLFFEVLQDLARQGWSFAYQSDQLLAFPPSSAVQNHSDREEIKRQLRNFLVDARDEQLREEPVKRFVLNLERPRWHGWHKVSVLDLLVSPQEFASDLKRRLDAPEEIRNDLLKDAIQPYLQMATEERDEFTGIRLIDVWRYCRYTWSLPLSYQPGRSMLYLVRDAAREFHPIIGIGALGNSMVQLTCRDNEIGWSLASLQAAPDAARHVGALRGELDRAIGDVFWEDLLSEEEVNHPTPEALARLMEAAKGTSRLNRSLRRTLSKTLMEDTLSPLYRRKRATELYRLLRAKRTMQVAAQETTDDKNQLAWLSARGEGRQALGVALRAVKKRHVGSSIMDITTCGALPPFSEVLGGKLTALLMASPQVIADYRRRYRNTPSEIASRMKGAEVVRPADLVLLGTTSLYHVGSSQYNRLKAPTAKGEIRYLAVGKTSGYGSVHISRRTYLTLQKLLRRHPDLEIESNAFAAGVNYKMRSIGSGLSHVGLGKLQKHENPRLVYLVPLATNWRAYLTGLEESPSYLYADVDHSEQETAHLIEFWKERWFIPRVLRPETLQRLEHQGEDTLRVSDLGRYDELGAQSRLF